MDTALCSHLMTAMTATHSHVLQVLSCQNGPYNATLADCAWTTMLLVRCVCCIASLCCVIAEIQLQDAAAESLTKHALSPELS